MRIAASVIRRIQAALPGSRHVLVPHAHSLGHVVPVVYALRLAVTSAVVEVAGLVHGVRILLVHRSREARSATSCGMVDDGVRDDANVVCATVLDHLLELFSRTSLGSLGRQLNISVFCHSDGVIRALLRASLASPDCTRPADSYERHRQQRVRVCPGLCASLRASQGRAVPGPPFGADDVLLGRRDLDVRVARLSEKVAFFCDARPSCGQASDEFAVSDESEHVRQLSPGPRCPEYKLTPLEHLDYRHSIKAVGLGLRLLTAISVSNEVPTDRSSGGRWLPAGAHHCNWCRPHQTDTTSLSRRRGLSQVVIIGSYRTRLQHVNRAYVGLQPSFRWQR